MILLPDEDEEPVGAQVYAVIGEALRQSVAEAELSLGFASRLATALDEEGTAPDAQASAANPAGGTVPASAAAAGEAGRGSEAAEVAS